MLIIEVAFYLRRMVLEGTFSGVFSVVSALDGPGMIGFLHISVLYHHPLCCGCAGCCGGPEMTCFSVFFA